MKNDEDEIRNGQTSGSEPDKPEKISEEGQPIIPGEDKKDKKKEKKAKKDKKKKEGKDGDKKDKKKKKKKPVGLRILKGVLITLVVLACIVALPFAALSLALSDKCSGYTIDKIEELLELNADVQVGSIDYTLLGTLPDISLKFTDVVVISHVFEPNDTLLVADTLDAVANPFLGDGPLLSAIGVKKLHLINPDVYVKHADGKYNFEVISFAEDTLTAEEDTSSFAMPAFYVRDVKLAGGRVRYEDFDDSLSAAIENINLDLPRARYMDDSISGGMKLTLDTLYLDMIADEVSCGMGSFALMGRAAQFGEKLLLDMGANSPAVSLRSKALTANNKELNIRIKGITDSAFSAFKIDTVAARLDSMTVSVLGNLRNEGRDSLYADLNAHLRLPEVNNLMPLVPADYKKYVKGLNVKGALKVDATAKGYLAEDRLPVVKADLRIDHMKLKYSQFPEKIDDFHIDLTASYDQDRKDSTFVKINRMFAKTGPTMLAANGWAGYKNGNEYVDLALKTHLNLHTVNNIYRIEPKSEMSGVLDADIAAHLFLKDIKERNLYEIYSKFDIVGDDVRVKMPEAGLNLYVDSLNALLTTNVEQKRKHRTDTALFSTRFAFSELDLNYQDGIKVKSSRVNFRVLADDIEKGKVPRFRVSASLGGMRASVYDTIKAFAKNGRVSLTIRKDTTYYFAPRTTARLKLDSILVVTPDMGYMLRKTDLKVSTLPRFRRRKKNAEGKRVPIPMSEQRIYDLPYLLHMFDTISKSSDPMELYLKRFRSDGNIQVRGLRAKDPTNPIRMAVNRVNVDFTDDTLNINRVTVRYGRSRVKLSGEVTNMRRYLLRGRTLKADLNLSSKRVDLNQILRALYESNEQEELMTTHEAKADSVAKSFDELSMAMADDEAESESTEVVDSTAQSSLIVIPDNLDIKFGADVDTVFFGRMQLRDFKGDVSIKNSTIKLKQFSTSTQLGNAGLNVMYKCDNDTVADAALTVDLDSVQIGDIVTYIPEVDSIMPMLRSFRGDVTCEASASLKLDSAMNINMPSVNAGVWLRGENLVLLDGETFSEIAKMLMFSKKTENLIDSISVEMLMRNNEVEIFPFMVSMDKYRLGAGGTQSVDGSFNYHIVLLKSPLLFRIGLDVYGEDFDNIKFKLSSPQFKNSTVKIGTGGVLVNTSTVNLRKVFHETMRKTILSAD